MDKKQIEEKMNDILEFAKTFYKTKSEFMSMVEIIVLEGDKRSSCVVALAGEQAIEKRRAILRTIGEGMATGNFPPDKKCMPIAVFFISEAWVTKYAKGELKPNEAPPRPSEDPRKQEAFIIQATTYDKKNYMRSYEIRRDKEIELVKSIEFSGKTSEKLESNLLNEFWKGYESKINIA